MDDLIDEPIVCCDAHLSSQSLEQAAEIPRPGWTSVPRYRPPVCSPPTSRGKNVRIPLNRFCTLPTIVQECARQQRSRASRRALALAMGQLHVRETGGQLTSAEDLWRERRELEEEEADMVGR